MLTIPCPSCQESVPIYTTAEAARYLGISQATVKYHVHVAGNLRPHRLGNSLFFTQAQLDEFQASRRPVGRPKTTEEVQDVPDVPDVHV